jgi:hypothetical protein
MNIVAQEHFAGIDVIAGPVNSIRQAMGMGRDGR